MLAMDATYLGKREAKLRRVEALLRSSESSKQGRFRRKRSKGRASLKHVELRTRSCALWKGVRKVNSPLGVKMWGRSFRDLFGGWVV